MGNKVNPIALRIGEQVNGFNGGELKNNNREDLLDYLIINTTIENILKKNNIFVSELVVKKKNDIGLCQASPDNNDYEIGNIDTECQAKPQARPETKPDNKGIKEKQEDSIDYFVSGVVYRSNTLGKEKSDVSSIKENGNKYIEVLNKSERKSLKGENLLVESYILIEKILEEGLNKKIRIELKEISGAIFNARILSSGVEKSMGEDKYGLNDKKIINIFRESSKSK